jgi:hypothetical protein
MARGIRNNNPGNIRKSNQTFQGEKVSTDASFKQFVSMDWGYRAIFVILSTYLKNGFNTVEKIISRWAPPVENNTRAYIDTVVRMSGVPKDKILTAKEGESYIKIVEAISFVENGAKADKAQIEAGFRSQSDITR